VGGHVEEAHVVAQSQFVPHEHDWQPALAEHDGVSEQQSGNGEVDPRVVFGLEGQLESGEARRGAADPAIAGRRVVLEHQPAREGTGKPPGIEVGEKGAV
jgi:hypothetical protein